MAAFPGFLIATLIGAAKAVRRITKAMANRRTASDLMTWDDRALKDIGLTRSDLIGAMALPLSVDPTLHLHSLSRGHKPAMISEMTVTKQFPLEPAAHLPSIVALPAS